MFKDPQKIGILPTLPGMIAVDNTQKVALPNWILHIIIYQTIMQSVNFPTQPPNVIGLAQSSSK